MKRLGWLLSILAGLLLAAPAALADDQPAPEDKPKPAKKKGPKEGKKAKADPGMRGEYGMMAEVLKLDEATAKKLQEQVAANGQAVKDWQEANGAKLKELMGQHKELRQDKEKEAEAKKVAEEIKALQDARAKLEEDGRAKVMALLTDDQKKVWAGFVLRRGLMRSFRGIKLEQAQIDQIQGLCETAAATMPDAKDRTKQKERTEAVKKLIAEIESKVLTKEQADALKQAREKKPAPKEPKPKGQKPEKGKKGGKGEGEGEGEPTPFVE